MFIRWSGITEESLKDVTTSLDSARKSLLALLESSRKKTGRTPILLGHSLENDLQALKLRYPRIIDTALLYHHPRGRPRKPGLAWLTKKYCGREIQNKPGGHDPREDAQACAGEYACKVVVVADDGLAEREGKLCFHSEDIEALDDENREIHFSYVSQPLLRLRQ